MIERVDGDLEGIGQLVPGRNAGLGEAQVGEKHGKIVELAEDEPSGAELGSETDETLRFLSVASPRSEEKKSVVSKPHERISATVRSQQLVHFKDVHHGLSV